MTNTLDYYNNNAEKYFVRTNQISLETAYPYLLKRIPKSSHILDLGSGSGRDSRYFMDHGYKVTAVDGSKGLAEKAKEKLGVDVQVKSFNELTAKLEYDAVWASCSLLHASDEDLKIYIPKIHAALKFGGILYASFKFGKGSAVDPLGRYFNYQDFDSLLKLFSPFGFDFQLIEKIESYVSGVQTQWVHIALKKQMVTRNRLETPSGKFQEQYEFLKAFIHEHKLDMGLIEEKRMEKSALNGSFLKGVYLEKIDSVEKKALIRDYLPQLFEKQKRPFVTKALSGNALEKELFENKLQEELLELKSAKTYLEVIEELGDVLEVLETLEHVSYRG